MGCSGAEVVSAGMERDVRNDGDLYFCHCLAALVEEGGELVADEFVWVGFGAVLVSAHGIANRTGIGAEGAWVGVR